MWDLWVLPGYANSNTDFHGQNLFLGLSPIEKLLVSWSVSKVALMH
jgi:hypothetical protein